MSQIYDVAVIGGGINGCGIAADAAMRGLSVVLIEKDDIASKTSSSSTKLIHGGLRYLEYYNFSLVKKSLDERQTLLKLAPHLVHPLPIVLPHKNTLRSSWILRLGLFLYDNLSQKNKLPTSKLIRRRSTPIYFSPLTAQFEKSFLFYDCKTDDARLTLANALQAKEHGAAIVLHTDVVQASVTNRLWHLKTKSLHKGEQLFVARTVINATGPWVEPINQLLGIQNHYRMSLVKGSHLVVPKLYEGQHAYLLQNEDQRIVFVIPYHGYTMIGTTDVIFSGNPDEVIISTEEIDYLCKSVGNYFKRSLSSLDIINTWSGVRPLLAALDNTKPQALTRDYTYVFSDTAAPAITIYGGKITTYRQLALNVVNQLKTVFPTLQNSNTAKTPLPGAIWGKVSFTAYREYAQAHYYWLDTAILKRLLETYGTKTETILAACNTIQDMGEHFGNGLYQCEIDYLLNEEWASSCEDILWRRTKLGLYFTATSTKQLEAYIQSKIKDVATV